MTALGIATEKEGALLAPMVLSKLPNDIALEYSRKLESLSDKGVHLDVQQLLKFLSDEIMSRERVVSYKRRSFDNSDASTSDDKKGRVVLAL